MTKELWDEKLETLPIDRRRILHDHRVRWQVRRCWDGSLLYRARFVAAGIEPTTFGGLADLSRIPLLDARDLPFDDGRQAPAPGWTVAPAAWWSGEEGGAGSPRRVLTEGDLLSRADLAARALWAAGGRPGHPLVVTAVEPDVDQDVLSAGAERVGIWLSIDTIDRAGAGVVWSTTWPPPTASDERPLGALALPGVAPTVAYACGAAPGLHWADDHFLIEVVDPDSGEAVAAGAPGALVITDLTREGSPLVRLWTGLQTAIVEAPCRCGRTSARSSTVQPLP